jgi:multicomponent Na+:H+ antiporter subunit D
MPMAPLPVVIPLAVAAALAGMGAFLPRRALDLVALATTGTVLAICWLLTIASSNGVIVYWFGG